MDSDLATRRRVLLLTYQRYIVAERAWTDAQRELKAWFPRANQPSAPTIGDPGSIIRRLYDHRERTILQLEVAHMKLELAKRRLEEKRQERQTNTAWLLISDDPR